MSIVLIPFPPAIPPDITAWEKSIEVMKTLSLGINLPVKYDFSSDTVKQGVIIMIGGSLYQSTTDTAITGTPSDYVKITAAGATASAAYVANLTGVTWNSVYNFYEDVSGNAYIFDETMAVFSGELSEAKTVVGELVKVGNGSKVTAQRFFSNEDDSITFAFFEPFLPNVGDELLCHGTISTATGTSPVNVNVNRIERSSATAITAYGFGSQFISGAYAGNIIAAQVSLIQGGSNKRWGNLTI